MPPHLFTVSLHDVDSAGVLFFSHLFRHAHDAYEGLMDSLGFPLPTLIAEGVRLPLTHAEADYLHPLGHGEAISIEVEITDVGRTSFALGYRFIDKAGHVRAEAATVHVHVDPATEQSAPLPPLLAETLAAGRGA